MKDERRELNRAMESRMAILETKVDNIDKNQCESDKRNAGDHNELKDGIKEVRANIAEIAKTIDQALNNKADKTDLEKLDSKFWGIIITLLGLSLGVIFAIFK
jgi:uncharacterized phage infection (PIP) family protein YhgE